MRTLYDHYSDQGNISGSATDVYVDVIKGNTLLRTGDKLIAEYIISCPPTDFGVNIKFGFTTSVELENLIEGDNYIKYFLFRIGAGSIKGYVQVINSSGTFVQYITPGGDFTLASDANLKLIFQDTSEEPADNTIVAKLGTISYSPGLN